MAHEAPMLPLSSSCHHYTKDEQVPKHLLKYWKQRYAILPDYQKGMYLTDDAWFGTTPQTIAQEIANDLVAISGGPRASAVVIDLFAGAGSNAIAFARSGHWSHVIAIEKDRDVLACAQMNETIPGLFGKVEDNGGGVGACDITWLHGDCFELLPMILRDGILGSGVDDAHHHHGQPVSVDPRDVVLFASPPWGGVAYSDQPVFDLAAMAPYNLQTLHDACWPLPHALYLPRTSDLQQLADAMDDDADYPDAANRDGKPPRIDVTHYCLGGASKALVAYYPGNVAAVAHMATHQPEAGTKKRKRARDKAH